MCHPLLDTGRRKQKQESKPPGFHRVCVYVCVYMRNNFLYASDLFPHLHSAVRLVIIEPLSTITSKARLATHHRPADSCTSHSTAHPLAAHQNILFIAWCANSTPKKVAALAGTALASAGPKPGKKALKPPRP